MNYILRIISDVMGAVNKSKLNQIEEFIIVMHAQFQSVLIVFKRQRLFGKKKTYLLMKRTNLKMSKD